MGTGRRVADAFLDELCAGYTVSIDQLVAENRVGAKDAPAVILARDVPITIMCPHHLLPAIGKAQVAFAPKGRLIRGGRHRTAGRCALPATGAPGVALREHRRYVDDTPISPLGCVHGAALPRLHGGAQRQLLGASLSRTAKPHHRGAVALELARRGVGVALWSRSKTSLRPVSAELKSSFRSADRRRRSHLARVRGDQPASCTAHSSRTPARRAGTRWWASTSRRRSW